MGPVSEITCLIMTAVLITAARSSDTVVSNPPLGVSIFFSGRVGSAVGVRGEWRDTGMCTTPFVYRAIFPVVLCVQIYLISVAYICLFGILKIYPEFGS